MPAIKVMLDPESLQALAARAFEERRPMLWQAEVLLLQALGRWPTSPATDAPATREGSCDPSMDN
jgi:hypothetical protein